MNLPQSIMILAMAAAPLVIVIHLIHEWHYNRRRSEAERRSRLRVLGEFRQIVEKRPENISRETMGDDR